MHIRSKPQYRKKTIHSSCLGTHYVDQADLELSEGHLSAPKVGVRGECFKSILTKKN